MRLQKLILACIPAALLVFVACSQSTTYSEALERGPASVPDNSPEASVDFDLHAFPPVLPLDASHGNGPIDSWQSETCLTCHAAGKNDAPVVVHKDMSDILLKSKCRTCHTSAEG